MLHINIPRILCALLGICQANTLADNHYVDLRSLNPDLPYTNWNSAAMTIQEAINAASPGDIVWVTNGTYNIGSTPTPGATLANRVIITNNIEVRSVMGPTMTTILGAKSPSPDGFGTEAVRCVYITHGFLEGFTLTNGSTCISGDRSLDQSGGGAYAAGGLLTNCYLCGNQAACDGGGAWGGELRSCHLKNNTSLLNGGGAYNAVLSSCTLISNVAYRVGGGAMQSTLTACSLCSNQAYFGGGAWGGQLLNCKITHNVAHLQGGGTEGSSLVDCEVVCNTALFDSGGMDVGSALRTLIASNHAPAGGGAVAASLTNCIIRNNIAETDGGGCYNSDMINCTVVGNMAGAKGGGSFWGSSINSIIWGNQAPTNANTFETTCSFSCTLPDPGGQGNVTTPPIFIDCAGGDYRLILTSPCIDAGTNLSAILTDILRIPRPLLGTAKIVAEYDIGAYEYVNASSDTDGDELLDAAELLADTNPTDPSSRLAIQSISLTNDEVQITWIGGRTAWQYIEVSETLTEQPTRWRTLLTNTPPTQPTNIYSHVLLTNSALFYRIRAQPTN